MSDEITTSTAATAPASTESSDNWSSDEKDSDLFDDVVPDKKPEPKAQAKAQPKAEAKPDTKEEKEVKAQKRFLKAKINGREESVDEETLIREYQKSRAGDERMAKASQIEKNTQAFFEALKRDPSAVLNHPGLGIDKRALAMKWLEEQVVEELEDPREREFKSQAERLKAYEERDAKAKAEAEQAEAKDKHDKAVKTRREELGSTFAKAMELTNLSKDKELHTQALRDMALEYQLAKRAGYQATPEELAQKVEAKYFKSMHSVTETLSGDELLDFFGDKFLNKLRKADLARHEAKMGRSNPYASKTSDWKSEPRKDTESKTIDPADWRLRMRDEK